MRAVANDDRTEVRKLRQQAGLTQEEAAEACGMPLRTMQSYDRGEREPPASKMDHIRKVLSSKIEDTSTFPDTLPTRSSALQVVPEIEAGAGDEIEVVSDGLKMPAEWIRQTYSVQPDRVCIMRLRGDSMVDTLQPGQRVVASRHEGQEPIQDGVIYGLRNHHGFTVKRLKFDFKDGEEVIWIWPDNPKYEEQRRYMSVETFHDRYDVIAKALEVGRKL